MTDRAGLRDRHPLVERVGYHTDRVRAWARRAAPMAILVRGVVWAAGVAALLVAAPATIPLGAAIVVGVLVAGASAAWPGTGWVSGVALSAVGAVALSLGQGEHRGGGAVALAAVVATLLYLHHSAAATAAQLRTDALVPPVVLRQWAGRTAAVLAGSAVIGGGVVVLPAALPAWPATYLVLLGAVAACAVAATLVYLVRVHLVRDGGG